MGISYHNLPLPPLDYQMTIKAINLQLIFVIVTATFAVIVTIIVAESIAIAVFDTELFAVMINLYYMTANHAFIGRKYHHFHRIHTSHLLICHHLHLPDSPNLNPQTCKGSHGKQTSYCLRYHSYSLVSL